MKPRSQRIADDIAMVAKAHNTTVSDLMSRSRFREHVEARHAAYWLIWWKYGFNLPQTGRVFGREHDRILYGIGRHLDRCNIDHPWMRSFAARKLKRMNQRNRLSRQPELRQAA